MLSPFCKFNESQAYFIKVPVTKAKALQLELAALSSQVTKLKVQHCGLSKFPSLKWHNLQEVDLSSNKLTCQSLRPLLLNNTKVRKLNLSNNKGIDNQIQCILNQLKQLQQLILSNVAVTSLTLLNSSLLLLSLSLNHSLVRLAIQAPLHSLDLSATALPPFAIPSLRSLFYNCCQFQIKSFEYENLICLQLQKYRIDQQMLQLVSLNKSLRKLDISGSTCSLPLDLRSQSLQELNIDQLAAPSLLLTALPSLSVLSANSLKVFPLNLLNTIKSQLRVLLLQNNQISDYSFLSQDAFRSLKILSIRGNPQIQRPPHNLPPFVQLLALPPCSRHFPIPSKVQQLILQIDQFTLRDQHFNKNCQLSEPELHLGWSEQMTEQVKQHGLKVLRGVGQLQIQGVQCIAGSYEKVYQFW